MKQCAAALFGFNQDAAGVYTWSLETKETKQRRTIVTLYLRFRDGVGALPRDAATLALQPSAHIMPSGPPPPKVTQEEFAQVQSELGLPVSTTTKTDGGV